MSETGLRVGEWKNRRQWKEYGSYITNVYYGKQIQDDIIGDICGTCG